MKLLFLKVTAVVAVAIIALLALFAVIKILVIAAIVAAFVIAGVAITNFLRGRRSGQLVNYEPPRYDARRYR